jgi:hypothetical protein
MSRGIRESDWKLFRQLHRVALERFCEQVLSEIVSAASDASQTSHERYLVVYELVHRRNQELADAFDDLRRSTAIQKLADIQSHKLLTEEEMSRFGVEARNEIQMILDIWRE